MFTVIVTVSIWFFIYSTKYKNYNKLWLNQLTQPSLLYHQRAFDVTVKTLVEQTTFPTGLSFDRPPHFSEQEVTDAYVSVCFIRGHSVSNRGIS